jgi:hypothetical protein
MNLDQAQLERRSKELDAREAFIDTKAKILKDAPITLKVYDARVKASEEMLENILKKNKEAVLHRETIETDIRNAEIRSQQTNNLLEQQTLELHAAITVYKNTISELKKEEKDLEKQTEIRKTYLEDQEKIISSTIDEGNGQLIEINDDIIRQKESSRALNAKYIILKRDFDSSVLVFETTKQEYDEKLEDLKSQKSNLLHELDTLAANIQKKSVEYQHITKVIDDKVAYVKEIEESLATKRDAIVLERQELEKDKRRWSGTKAIYDI